MPSLLELISLYRLLHHGIHMVTITFSHTHTHTHTHTVSSIRYYRLELLYHWFTGIGRPCVSVG